LLERALRMAENLRESEREAVSLEICAEIASAGEAMEQAREAIQAASIKA